MANLSKPGPSWNMSGACPDVTLADHSYQQDYKKEMLRHLFFYERSKTNFSQSALYFDVYLLKK